MNLFLLEDTTQESYDFSRGRFNNIIEQELEDISLKLFKMLLMDRTTKKNICWATDSYIYLGSAYYPQEPITKDLVTGINNKIIRPRIAKDADEQAKRRKEKAEVFTPSWVCNKQNNLIDEAWFGRKDVFNKSENKSWKANKDIIKFPKDKNWRDYVDLRRLEVSCGEAPYLVSRYDTVTGREIPIEERIGLLDRKIRVINENTSTEDEWFYWIKRAYESIYGYEYQGDNLLIARKNLLYTFIENMEYKFSNKPNEEQLKVIAGIISWNIWQMDGVTMNVPYSERHRANTQLTMFNLLDNNEISDLKSVPCRIYDWRTNNSLEFKGMINGGDAGKMKFDAIVGNPPYMEMDGGGQASAKPIYQHFVSTSKTLKPNYLSFIIPTRWYAGGKGLDKFRDEMLNDEHIEALYDCVTPNDTFPNTNIRGGVCYFLWNYKYDNHYNKTNVITMEHGKEPISIKRILKVDGLDIFIRYSHAINIMKKVLSMNEDTLDNYVSPRRPFGIDSNIVKSTDYKPNEFNGSIMCFGKGQTYGYISNDLVRKHHEWINMWKIFTPKANNIGTELNDDNLNCFIGKPGIVCTESYLMIGVGLNLDEEICYALSKYLTTRFARFMHSIAKASQNATAKTYRFVPMQNFNKNSDIDWSKSVEEIDKQLYVKYSLSKEEISFIEEKIKPMK